MSPPSTLTQDILRISGMAVPYLPHGGPSQPIVGMLQCISERNTQSSDDLQRMKHVISRVANTYKVLRGPKFAEGRQNSIETLQQRFYDLYGLLRKHYEAFYVAPSHQRILMSHDINQIVTQCYDDLMMEWQTGQITLTLELLKCFTDWANTATTVAVAKGPTSMRHSLLNVEEAGSLQVIAPIMARKRSDGVKVCISIGHLKDADDNSLSTKSVVLVAKYSGPKYEETIKAFNVAIAHCKTIPNNVSFQAFATFHDTQRSSLYIMYKLPSPDYKLPFLDMVSHHVDTDHYVVACLFVSLAVLLHYWRDDLKAPPFRDEHALTVDHWLEGVIVDIRQLGKSLRCLRSLGNMEGDKIDDISWHAKHQWTCSLAWLAMRINSIVPYLPTPLKSFVSCLRWDATWHKLECDWAASLSAMIESLSDRGLIYRNKPRALTADGQFIDLQDSIAWFSCEEPERQILGRRFYENVKECERLQWFTRANDAWFGQSSCVCVGHEDTHERTKISEFSSVIIEWD